MVPRLSFFYTKPLSDSWILTILLCNASPLASESLRAASFLASCLIRDSEVVCAAFTRLLHSFFCWRSSRSRSKILSRRPLILSLRALTLCLSNSTFRFSAVDRVVDGLAHRMDRLKALGNGQVASVVPFAWHQLRAKAGI